MTITLPTPLVHGETFRVLANGPVTIEWAQGPCVLRRGESAAFTSRRLEVVDGDKAIEIMRWERIET